MSGSKRSIPELSSEARILASMLSKMEPGQVITYDELSGMIGVSSSHPTFKARLGTARNIALRDHSVVTECVRGEGVKRLQANELQSVGDDALSRIRRTATRGTRKMLSGASVLAPSGEALNAMNTRLSMLGVMREMTSHKSIDAAAKKVAMGNSPLSTVNMLENALQAMKG